MKIYRVSLDVTIIESDGINPGYNDGHSGYQYFLLKRHAKSFLKEWERNNGKHSASLEVESFPVTRVGLITALNRWGSHPYK